MSLNFNIKNGDIKFPLFFGEPSGLFDAFNVKYPQILEADERQQELFWKAGEISQVQDAKDLIDINDNIKEIFIRALSFQMAADSMASGSIAQLFLPCCSNPQLESMISYHSMVESTHAKAYGLIIGNVFKDPNLLLKRIREDTRMLSRIDFIMLNFNNHNNMLTGLANGVEYSTEYKHKTVIRTVTTLLALEGIMFLSSFASTFAVSESTQKLNGIAKEIGLIFNDEVLHANNCMTILNILSEEYPEWDDMKTEIKYILDTTIKAEQQWAKDLFIETGDIIGFNSNTLSDYTKYLAESYYKRLNIDFDFTSVKDNPLPWINIYIKPDLLQVAAQEAQLTNYLTGVTNNDCDDIKFIY